MRRRSVSLVLILSLFLLSGCGRGLGPIDPDPDASVTDDAGASAVPELPDVVPRLAGGVYEFAMSVDGSFQEGLAACVSWEDRVYIPVDALCAAIRDDFVSIRNGKVYIRRVEADPEGFGVHGAPDGTDGLYVMADYLSDYTGIAVTVPAGGPDGPDVPVIEIVTAMPDRIMYGSDVFLVTEYAVPPDNLESDPSAMTHDGRAIWNDDAGRDDRIWIEADDGTARLYAKSHIYDGVVSGTDASPDDPEPVAADA